MKIEEREREMNENIITSQVVLFFGMREEFFSETKSIYCFNRVKNALKSVYETKLRHSTRHHLSPSIFSFFFNLTS